MGFVAPSKNDPSGANRERLQRVIDATFELKPFVSFCISRVFRGFRNAWKDRRVDTLRTGSVPARVSVDYLVRGHTKRLKAKARIRDRYRRLSALDLGLSEGQHQRRRCGVNAAALHRR